MPRRKLARRPGRKARKGGRRKANPMPAIATAGSGQMCRIVETFEGQDTFSNKIYQNVFSLAQFPRAAALAPYFQFYKAAKVTYTYEPLYNTFQEGSNFSKPYMYTLMARNQITVPYTLDNLQECGARPRAFSSTLKIAYKPNWCSPGLVSTSRTPEGAAVDVVVNNGLQVQYKWLASPSIRNANTPLTDQNDKPLIDSSGAPDANLVSNNVVYNGHYNFIDQLPVATQNLICRTTITVEWLFKGAKYPVASA